jgi:hypothetical protein
VDTESPDLLKAFCEGYISQHREKWPTSERQLAKAFVSHFDIPFVFRVSDLHDFLVQTNIELIERDLPSDLLGVNMCFGTKRQIRTSRNADHVRFGTHTVLHEIREILEADFRELGFSTTNLSDLSDLDSRADDFSFGVDMCTGTASLMDWIKDARETNSTLVKIAVLCIAIIIVVVLEKRSRFGAFGYRLEGPSVKRPRRKHI